MSLRHFHRPIAALLVLASLTALQAADRLAPLVRLLATSEDSAVQLDVLRGMHEALAGRRPATPTGWPEAYRKLVKSPSSEVRDKAMQLAVVFGDKEAIAALRALAADPHADEGARRAALQALAEGGTDGLAPLLRSLVADRAVRSVTVRALARFGDPQTPRLLLSLYSSFSEPEKAESIATLTSRKDYALALLDAMEQGKVPRRDLSAFGARQLLALKSPELAERLNNAWGSLRPPGKDVATLLARYRSLATPEQLAKANRGHGRALFQRSCATCHTLFDEGAKIGPDLTGSQRANPDYVLAKVLDPSAVVARDYQITVVTTSAGRTISGLVKEEDDRLLTLQTPTEVVRVAKTDIEERRKSNLSLMPDGLLVMLSDSEVRDLIAYLAGPGKVPLPR